VEARCCAPLEYLACCAASGKQRANTPSARTSAPLNMPELKTKSQQTPVKCSRALHRSLPLQSGERKAHDPSLTVCNKDGQIESVRYTAVNAMLLNEFLREHKIVEEQGAIIAQLQKQVEALTAGLEKMSAELNASKPGLQLANNP